MRADSPDLARRALAEAIAAFFLVFAGCGAIVANATSAGSLGNLGVALAFGLVIAAGVWSTGHLSGAHINPAVTVAFALTRHFPAREVPWYVAAQIVGACAGAFLLLALWPEQPAALGATVPAAGIGAGKALVYEIALSALLMFVIMAVATDTRAVGAAAALAIGGAVGLDAIFGGPVTGASMNPARSLGPALAAGEWQDFWVYLVGPLTGTALGAFAYLATSGGTQPDAELDAPA